jgi:hypothetical protein
MASIRKEISIDAPPEEVLGRPARLRAPHERLEAAD